jgi:queuine/archaeosine tRNA-ribosyltransferase
MKGVAQGLHTLHKADIVHGSLHQNNVFALNRFMKDMRSAIAGGSFAEWKEQIRKDTCHE